MLFDQHFVVEDLLYMASASSTSCLFLCQELLSFGFQSVKGDYEHDLVDVTNEGYHTVVLALPYVTLLWWWDDQSTGVWVQLVVVQTTAVLSPSFQDCHTVHQ